MKRSPNFLLREVAGTLVIVPVGEAAAKFKGMITLNATSAYLWEILETQQTKESLVKALTDRYEVDEETASKDVDALLEKLAYVEAVTGE